LASANARGLYKGMAPPPTVAHVPVHHVTTAKVIPPPPASTGMTIDVYQGDKKPDVVKCSDDGCESK
jgi:hypothetical protein